jgi:hypothetical protein
LQVLLKNKALQRIDLSENIVGDEGAMLLLENLKKSESSISIDYIGLRSCGISNRVCMSECRGYECMGECMRECV